MFDENAFQQDALIAELSESDIVKRPVSSTTKTLGVALVNHNRNNNVRIQIRPKRVRPELPSPVPTHQNPTAFVDDVRGELNMCLTHADKFIISCAGAPKHYVFASSFGQMVSDLARNNPNINIYINGNVHRSSEFISGSGTKLSFNPQFLEQYGIVYTDTLGNYRMVVSGARSVRFELRVFAPGNGMSPNQVTTLFGQSTTEVNDTAVYHSNTDFYGFTFCIESSSVPSLTRIDYATFETMDELITSGVIDKYNSEANKLTIKSTVVGEESQLAAEFKARLLNTFDTVPVRKQDYLLVLESPDIDLTTLDLTKLRANYDIYQVAPPAPAAKPAMRTMAAAVTASTENPQEGTLLESGIMLDTSKLYRLNGKVVYPMTMEENDNGRYIKFRIDFDGDAGLFTEAEHRLNIQVSKAADVTIPLLVDYETDKPQNLSDLTYAVFDRFQFYQFAIEMKADSLLYVETPNMSLANVEVTIANRAPVVKMPTFTDRLVPLGSAQSWYVDTPKLVVVQLKVPIGLTGSVKIVQKPVKSELVGVKRSDAGKLTIDKTDPIALMTGTASSAKLWVSNTILEPYVQLFNELTTGSAIAARGIRSLNFVQGITDLRDYTLDNDRVTHLNSKSGAWIEIHIDNGIISYRSATVTKVVTPKNDVNVSDSFIVHELFIDGIVLHYYTLDANLVPVSYLGNSFVPWTYDLDKPVSVIASGISSDDYLGKAYVVEDGDLGPLRSDFVMSHNYDVLITDITEV